MSLSFNCRPLLHEIIPFNHIMWFFMAVILLNTSCHLFQVLVSGVDFVDNLLYLDK